MAKASEVALSAYAQAVKATKLEAAHEEALKLDAEREQLRRHREAYEAALPILAEWFPGVEWNWNPEGDDGYDTILTDRTEQYPWSFKLRVRHEETPEAGRHVIIEVGDYRPITERGVYGKYFAGTKVKGPADVGRYIQRRLETGRSV